MIRCVIFDMDGVIADSEPLHHLAERRLLAPYGIHLDEETLKGFTGMGLSAMLGQIRDAFGIEDPLDALIARHQQCLEALFQERVMPVPHVLDLIRSLHGAGYRLAVGSSSHRRLIRLVLEKFEILHDFVAYVGGDEVKRGKPDPEIFLAVAERLRLCPSDCAVIEDSRHGVAAARAAGMFCIGFRNPSTPSQDLSLADWIVEDLAEITPERLLARASQSLRSPTPLITRGPYGSQEAF